MPRPISEWKRFNAIAVKARRMRHARLLHALRSVRRNVMDMEPFEVEAFNEAKHTARKLDAMCATLYDFLLFTLCHEETIVNLGVYRRDAFEVRRMLENPLGSES